MTIACDALPSHVHLAAEAAPSLLAAAFSLAARSARHPGAALMNQMGCIASVDAGSPETGSGAGADAD